FTATDACSQTQTCNAIFTVASPPALIINCPAPGSTASCQTQAAVNTAFTTWLSTVSASGGCGTISYSNNNTGAPLACGGNVTVTFTATDACSQTQTCSAIFTVASPPALIINCPAPGNTASCQTQAAVNSAYASWLSTATASGGCGSLSISNNSTGAPPACGGTVTVSFSVMDACAQTQTCSANFTVAADNTPPVFTNPSDQTVSCISAIPATESLSYTDNCSPPGSVSLFVDGPPINICTGGSMTRTWTVNDACGNPATENKVYTILAPTPTACDDGNPCTINDMHTLGCDGITICVACAGTPTTPTTPTFSPIGPLCQGATAPALPTMSNNGISGTWNPSNIDTSIPNSTTYTFTPSGPGCYLPATLVIVVNAGPTLSVTESCSGGLGTGIINSTGTAGSGGTLTYTINGAPDPDGDATMLSNGTYTIVVTESPSGCTSSQTITINCACPTIVLNGPTTICQSAPPVTFTQTGGAGAGTWTVSPSGAGTINSSTGIFDPNNTYSGGVTITYTEGACSEVINVMITQTITPTFTNPGPICQSAGIITLPTSSTNSPPITGTWVPSTVDPSSGNDVTATFTPDANQCAEIVMMTIDILPSPTIMVDVSCVGGPGTGVINTTATAGSGGVLTYTINGTPDGDGDQNMLPNGAYTVVVTETPGGCTSSQTVNVNCTCPTINISGPLQVCQTATATFTQSGGNIGGTWSLSPSGAGTIDNTGFFNPTDIYNGPVNITYTADGCSGQTQIFVIELLTPIFTNPGPLCQSSGIITLPTSSNNTPPITGVWVPATIDPS
ncbi:MAG TPA: hypothetical protein PKC06_10470, partial [Saprospiraceae bacterium]|nr:hypothetical protein [Saprospiraceae bacterium]